MSNLENDPFASSIPPHEKSVLPISIKEWVITIIITAIPLVGIIMLFVWAFGGGDVNPNKKNYAIAALIVAAIFIILYFLFFATLGAVFFSSFNH